MFCNNNCNNNTIAMILKCIQKSLSLCYFNQNLRGSFKSSKFKILILLYLIQTTPMYSLDSQVWSSVVTTQILAMVWTICNSKLWMNSKLWQQWISRSVFVCVPYFSLFLSLWCFNIMMKIACKNFMDDTYRPTFNP